MIIIAFHVFAY